MKKILLFALILLAASCEKAVVDGIDDDTPKDANVILHMRLYDQTDFTRAATDITQLCSRLSVVVFDTDGTKVKTVAQKKDEASFGTVAMSLASGTYQLVIIAHNGDGSATITSTDKVTFPNNKVTDTFYYYGSLEVTDNTQSHDLKLTRAVAMFRLILTDKEIPSNVTQMKFYYLGGSSTFSPSSGYGNVNSKQTEIRPVGPGVTTFEVFTMPHTENDVLTKITVTALDANDNTVHERVFEDVPITRNQVTSYTGKFFDSGNGNQQSNGNFRLTADPEWDNINSYSY